MTDRGSLPLPARYCRASTGRVYVRRSLCSSSAPFGIRKGRGARLRLLSPELVTARRALGVSGCGSARRLPGWLAVQPPLPAGVGRHRPGAFPRRARLRECAVRAAFGAGLGTRSAEVGGAGASQTQAFLLWEEIEKFSGKTAGLAAGPGSCHRAGTEMGVWKLGTVFYF